MKDEKGGSRSTGKGNSTHSSSQSDSVPLQNKSLVNKRLIVVYCFRVFTFARENHDLAPKVSPCHCFLQKEKIKMLPILLAVKKGKILGGMIFDLCKRQKGQRCQETTQNSENQQVRHHYLFCHHKQFRIKIFKKKPIPGLYVKASVIL